MTWRTQRLGRGRLLALCVLCSLVSASVLGVERGAAQEPKANPSPSTTTSTNAAATLGVKIATGVSPTTLSVGELAKLKLEVSAPASVEVSLPEQSFGGLELADRRLQTTVADGVTKTIYELDLLALEPGEVEIPALTVRAVGPNGELGSAQSEPKKLTVRSLIANEPNAEPKPVTKPVGVMHDDYTLAWIALGIALVSLIAFLTLRISRYLKQRPKPVVPAPPPRPAWELAFEKLHELSRQKDQLFQEQRGADFVAGVSDVVREYLGRRYGFDGLERTTGELLGTLEKLRPPKLSLSGVSLLLEQCDLVKFARQKPDAEQCQDLWNGALGLVRATTPSVTPSEPVQPAEAQS